MVRVLRYFSRSVHRIFALTSWSLSADSIEMSICGINQIWAKTCHQKVVGTGNRTSMHWVRCTFLFELLGRVVRWILKTQMLATLCLFLGVSERPIDYSRYCHVCGDINRPDWICGRCMPCACGRQPNDMTRPFRLPESSAPDSHFTVPHDCVCVASLSFEEKTARCNELFLRRLLESLYDEVNDVEEAVLVIEHMGAFMDLETAHRILDEIMECPPGYSHFEENHARLRTAFLTFQFKNIKSAQR